MNTAPATIDSPAAPRIAFGAWRLASIVSSPSVPAVSNVNKAHSPTNAPPPRNPGNHSLNVEPVPPVLNRIEGELWGPKANTSSESTNRTSNSAATPTTVRRPSQLDPEQIQHGGDQGEPDRDRHNRPPRGGEPEQRPEHGRHHDRVCRQQGEERPQVEPSDPPARAQPGQVRRPVVDRRGEREVRGELGVDQAGQENRYAHDRPDPEERRP